MSIATESASVGGAWDSLWRKDEQTGRVVKETKSDVGLDAGGFRFANEPRLIECCKLMGELSAHHSPITHLLEQILVHNINELCILKGIESPFSAIMYFHL